jgi:pimeloyl-ACP methyl ester carboxylesterase
MPKVTRLASILLAALALTAVFAASASARPSAGHAAAAKPTVVLVHGAWADGSSWSRVGRRLQHSGYIVKVAANPLRGVAGDAAYVAAVLAATPGPIVLVGHSYGGAVITNAAAGNSNVKALVFVNAFIPDQGETVIGLASARPGSQLGGNPAQVFDFVPYPGAPAGDVDLYVKPKLFASAFANDLPKAEGKALAASQRPLTLSAATESSGAPAWKTIRSWAVVGTADEVIPKAQQAFMARRADAEITRIKAGHMSMLSHPQAVTKVITRAARAVR